MRKSTLQYQDTAARAEGITAHSEMLGEKQKAMKYREGLTVAITNTLILLTVLAVLGVSLNLYQSGKMDVEGVLVCTLSALSSFGPVVALANLGASLTQVFASADRVLDLLDEQPVTADGQLYCENLRRCDRRHRHRICRCCGRACELCLCR